MFSDFCLFFFLSPEKAKHLYNIVNLKQRYLQCDHFRFNSHSLVGKYSLLNRLMQFFSAVPCKWQVLEVKWNPPLVTTQHSIYFIYPFTPLKNCQSTTTFVSAHRDYLKPLLHPLRLTCDICHFRMQFQILERIAPYSLFTWRDSVHLNKYIQLRIRFWIFGIGLCIY